jgi:hypothetical protein
MRRHQGEGRRQHLIQIHWMNLPRPRNLAKSPSGDP